MAVLGDMTKKIMPNQLHCGSILMRLLMDICRFLLVATNVFNQFAAALKAASSAQAAQNRSLDYFFSANLCKQRLHAFCKGKNKAPPHLFTIAFTGKSGNALLNIQCVFTCRTAAVFYADSQAAALGGDSHGRTEHYILSLRDIL